MAVLTAIVKPISNLKKLIKSMDSINLKEARLTIKRDTIYLDSAIKDPNSTNPVIARLCLNSKWFNAFEYCDRLHYSYPLTFDFSQFRREVLSCVDSHLLQLFVVTSLGQLEFQLRFFDGTILPSSGEVQPQKQSNISCKLSTDSRRVRTYFEIDELNPVSSGFYPIPSILILRSSILNNDPIDIQLSSQTVILNTRTAYHCFRTGMDCTIHNLNNPQETILFLRLDLNRASYIVQALTSTFVQEIDVIFPTWGKHKELPPILRIWFDETDAYLEFEFPWESVVHPQFRMNGLWFRFKKPSVRRLF